MLSNDIKTPNFQIDLIGFAENEIAQSNNEDISLNKEIDFNTNDFLIHIDNNSVIEDAAVNSLVGALSVPNSNDTFNFQLNSEDNDTDNQYFVIENNELKSNYAFNFEQKNTYVLRIKAINTTTSEVIESDIIINIINVTEDPILLDCAMEVNNIGFGLNDVEFIDNQHVVAVGSHGVILKSDDAGNSWRKIRNDIQSHLYTLQFTSSTIGYAMGDNFFKTEDAGETWFALNLPNTSYPYPNNLYFIDSDNGFVFGNDGKFYKTTNGGYYWKQKNIGYFDINSVFFINNSKGFVVGDSENLIVTLDGGESWETVDLDIGSLGFGTNFRNVFFVNDLTGFISTNNGKIIKTIDGGDSWTLMGEIQYGSSITEIFFQDENLGYALTEGALSKTIDGGETWVVEDIEYYYSGFQAVSFNNNETACLVGHGTSCCSGINTGHIIHTKELNNDWENKSYLSLRSSPLLAVFSNETIQYVFGDDLAAKSIDGGVTWLEVIPPEENIYQVEVISDHVYLLGQNNVYKSEDFGETWTTLSSSIYFRELFFINESTIFAASYGSGVYKSTDGGLNWLNVNTNASYGVDLFFKNENEGYVGTINEGMFRTLDGGNTWSQVPLEPVDSYLHVYSTYILNDIGFSGSSAGLLKTIDGGDTWERTYINLGQDIKFLHAINEVEWYAVSESMVFKSNDAGASWTTIYHGGDIEDVHFTTEKAYVVGDETFIEIDKKGAPTTTGYILGDTHVNSQSLVEFSVPNNYDFNYTWTVSGDNEINNTGHKAQVFWNSAGTYQITVTPFNDCGSGTAKEITVTVDENFNPTILGDQDVDEYAMDIEYSTELNTELRYDWFVSGHQDYSANNNVNSINWGTGELGLVKVRVTNENSGSREEAILNVNINSTSLPINNIDVEVISETCPGLNNGQVIISAIEAYNYLATINDVEYHFTETLIIDGLSPNNYELCVSVPEISYVQCYAIELMESETISGRYAVDSGVVSIDIDRGSAPYSVFINDQLYIEESLSTSFSLDVNHGDVIEVKTDKACEGSMLKTIDILDEVMLYPNPTNGNFYVKLPLEVENVTIDIFTSDQKLISSNNYRVTDGQLQLKLNEVNSGMYVVKVHLENPVILKLLKL
ncbi:YCF48-related protein [Winogradskyella vidalii]|uniref:YCF48-related protein n=1 Tax=Winogradskyella vidalii TaxID=2615024 RepID=UPI0015CD0BFC|nr:YCF48-related protein [Winogradskyella vidalii]